MQLNAELFAPTLLWENSNPSADFETTTINVNLSNYKYVIIEWRYYKAWYGSQIEKARLDNSNFINVLLSGTNQRYDLTTKELSSRELVFNKANGTIIVGSGNMNGSANSSFIIPIAIYGTNILQSYQLPTKAMKLNNNININLSQIVDDEGNARFLSGSGEDLTSLTGLTITYNKWSLSGSHIMFVVCGNVDNGTTIPHDYCLGNFLLPQWIIDKINPTFGTVGLETKTFNLYGIDFTNEPIEINEVVNAYLRKVQFFVKGNTTTTADRGFKIQFDLMID